MAEVCVLSLRDWLERDVSPYLPFASAERRARVERLRSAADRSRSLWAELFARWRVARTAGLAPASVGISHDGKGKPFWPGGSLSLSLSHSGGFVAVAVGGEAVGVDVERNRNMPGGIAERWFRPEERTLLRAMPEAARPHAFFRLWTLKEAALKYTGEGLAGGLGTVDCRALLDAARHGAEDALAGRNFAFAGGAIVGVVARRGILPKAARLFVIAERAAGVYGHAAFEEREPLSPMADAID